MTSFLTGWRGAAEITIMIKKKVEWRFCVDVRGRSTKNIDSRQEEELFVQNFKLDEDFHPQPVLIVRQQRQKKHLYLFRFFH